jgi:hypothetical protein
LHDIDRIRINRKIRTTHGVIVSKSRALLLSVVVAVAVLLLLLHR